MIDRRGFIGLAGAGALAFTRAFTRALAQGRGDTGGPPVVINALGGLDDPNHPDPGPARLTPRVLADARASGLTAVNVTMGYVAGPEAPFESSVADVAHWDTLVHDHPGDLLKVLTTADIARARRERKIGVIFGFQNAAMMGNDASRVDRFAEMGVRVIQLTYNGRNQLGDGSMVPEGRGLTPFGHEVVERLNASRVMVDLSHSGRQICLDAASWRSRRADLHQLAHRLPSWRSPTCRATRPTKSYDFVAEKGGFRRHLLHAVLDPLRPRGEADVVAHIEHALNICGEDHVGIGTDGGTTPIDDLQAYGVALAKEHADRVAKGMAATGEGVDTHPFVDDLRGPDQFRKLARLLAARGDPPRRIDKILGGNFVRYAGEIWTAGPTAF